MKLEKQQVVSEMLPTTEVLPRSWIAIGSVLITTALVAGVRFGNLALILSTALSLLAAEIAVRRLVRFDWSRIHAPVRVAIVARLRTLGRRRSLAAFAVSAEIVAIVTTPTVDLEKIGGSASVSVGALSVALVTYAATSVVFLVGMLRARPL